MDSRSRQEKEWDYEDRHVRAVLEAFKGTFNEAFKDEFKEFKLTKLMIALNEDAWQREGERRRLSFESFRKFFPTFPVVLESRYAGGVQGRCRLSWLFSNFDELYCMDPYMEVYELLSEEAQGRPVGLIVPFDGYRGGMIVHNGDFGTRSVKMTRHFNGDRPPYRVTIEPFDGLIKHLAKGPWTPKSPLPKNPTANGPEVSRDIPITAWMVQTVGDGPALVVLAWARKVLRSGSGYDRCFVRRVGQARRCLVASHEQIAAETGLSTRQVSRGLADLKRAGLVEPVGKTTRSGLVLSRSALLGAEDVAQDDVE